jgi:3-dehydroquinate synthase
VELGRRSYTVHIGTDLASRIGELLPRGLAPEKAILITHPGLATAARPVEESLRNAGIEVHPVEVAEGEGSKRWDAAGEILEQMAAAALHRRDMVVSFGGGVVTDLAGFVASTYARGIPVVHAATTLLAQVDAAIGGKTGVNLTSGKNLAGTFHQPAAVICDVALLRTLPEEEFTSGMAEVVKYGLIADPTILELLSDRVVRDEGPLEEIVTRSVSVKAEIVAADETERGARAFLNYGHTFAHAFELARGYGGIRHGEAVALGMMAAAYTANELGRIDVGLVDVHRRTLEAVGLPVAARFGFDELEPAWLRDKKYDRGVRFVLLAGPARPEAGVLVEREVVERALERLAV